MKLSQYINERDITGGDRIRKERIPEVSEMIIDKILKPYVIQKEGVYDDNVSLIGAGKTKHHGTASDIDLIMLVKGEDRKIEIDNFMQYIEKVPDDVAIPFKLEKNKDKKSMTSGELVTILFKYDGKTIQTDIIFTLEKEEKQWKIHFLELPLEKQGLIIAWAKVAISEYPEQFKFKFMKKAKIDTLEENERLEFKLSYGGLELRKISYEKNKEKKKKTIWKSKSWKDVEKVFPFDLERGFNQLSSDISKQIKKEVNKERVFDVFKSVVKTSDKKEKSPKDKKHEELQNKLKNKLGIKEEEKQK